MSRLTVTRKDDRGEFWAWAIGSCLVGFGIGVVLPPLIIVALGVRDLTESSVVTSATLCGCGVAALANLGLALAH